MKTKNHLPELPYFNVKKLDVMEKQLTKILVAEQNDFKRIAFRKRLSLSLKNVVTTPIFLRYYQSIKNRIILELHSICGMYEAHSKDYKNVRYSYLELVALKDDKALQQFYQRELAIEMLYSNTFFVDNEVAIAKGTNAHKSVLQHEMGLHELQAQHTQSMNTVVQARNQTLETDLEEARNHDIKSIAHENGVKGWSLYQNQDRKSTRLNSSH